MDAAFIQSIISLVVAVTPLLILIVTLISNRTERTTDPLDSSSLNIFTIKRYPVDDVEWKTIKFHHSFYRISINILCVLIYSSLIIYNILFLKSYVFSGIIILILILLSLISRFIVRPNIFTFYFKSPSSGARYFIFKEALIVIKSDRLYLFNKTLEVFKSMKFMIIEVREEEGYLEVCQIRSIREPIHVKVKIEKVDDIKSIYQVELEIIGSLSLLT